MSHSRKIPIINVGKYAGTPIDQLPNSYLRWMLTQNFPDEWIKIAKEKLKESPYSNDSISISRHAYDQYSLRFINRFNSRRNKNMGFGTFIAKEANHAWKKGKDVSKHRHKDDGTLKEYMGIIWVFNISKTFRDYKDVITIYPKDNLT